LPSSHPLRLNIRQRGVVDVLDRAREVTVLRKEEK